MQEGDDQINDSTEVIESQEVKNIDQINIKKLESFIKIFTPEINEKIKTRWILNILLIMIPDMTLNLILPPQFIQLQMKKV